MTAPDANARRISPHERMISQVDAKAKRSEKYDLTRGSILNKLLLVALPIMGTQIIQMAYNMTDMFWLGKIGSHAVAASGTVGMYMWLSVAFQMLGAHRRGDRRIPKSGQGACRRGRRVRGGRILAVRGVRTALCPGTGHIPRAAGGVLCDTGGRCSRRRNKLHADYLCRAAVYVHNRRGSRVYSMAVAIRACRS